MARSSYWKQIRAILIRNFLIKYHGKRQTIIELVMPLYFILILIIIRFGVPVTNIPQLTIPQNASVISSMSQLVGQQVGLLCNSTPDLLAALNAELSPFGSSAIQFETRAEMMDYFEKEYEKMTLSVECQQLDAVNISYVIWTMPELNLPDLNDLYAKVESCHPVYSEDPSEYFANQMSCSCPARKYYDVGFVQLQSLIDKIFVKHVMGDMNNSDTHLEMSAVLFPKSAFKGNTDYLRSFVPIYMALAFTPFVAYLCILIVGEKEKKIKEAMKLMGLRESVYWLGWLITYGALVLTLSIVSAVLMVVAKILPNANIFLIFVLIFLYGLSTITVAFLVTPFFNSAKAAGGFASFSSAVVSCLYYLSVYVSDVPTFVYYLMGLLAPTAFALGMDRAVYLDLVNDGVSYNTFWEEGMFCFGSAVVMLAVDIFLYGFLAFYFDNVIPGEYGRKRPPWFIFMSSFWCPTKYKDNKRTSLGTTNQEFVTENLANPNFENVTEEWVGKEVLRIFNIGKVYTGCRKENVVAVDGISLDMYEGQITAILGHNGAGKTTLLNMLVGLSSPTSGTATIYGLDIGDPNNYDQLWELLGICPQHDVLFDILTPRQHLEFFGRIKGIAEKELEGVIMNILKDVDLMDRINAPAGKMSGGQKRKLSIGIALIGDPKVVVLDEPTSGVDPFSRRQLWNLLQKSKAGRLIILTTHFMDEADILADRKAIISHGKVKCVGSSLFLKNRFGLGYHLTMAMEMNYDEKKASELIQSNIPQCEKVRNNATELAFLLPFNEVTKFPSLLSLLDEEVNISRNRIGNSIGVKGYGMSMTTLEEVFLKLCNDEDEDESKLEENGNLVQPIRHHGHKRNLSSTANLRKKCVIDNIPVRYNWWQAFAIMMKMNILAVVRQPRQICSTVILPIVLIIITFYLMTIPSTDSTVNYAVSLNTSFYPPYKLLYTNSTDVPIDSFLNKLTEQNVSLVNYEGTFAELLNTSDGHTFYLNFTSFEENNLKVGLQTFYNDTAQHSLPILVNLINNAVIRMTSAANDENVTVPNVLIATEPLPRHTQPNNIYGTVMAATIIIGFAYNIMTAVYTADSVEDRETKVRHQLQVSGLPFSVYWLSKFCGNYILFCVALVSTVVVVEAFQVEPLIQAAPMGILVLGYMLYMITALLFGYCFGFLFNKYDTAQSFVGILYMIMGFAPYIAVCITDMLAVNNGKTASLMHYIFTACLPLYPPYAILYYLDKVYNTALIQGIVVVNPSDYFSTEIIVTLIILPVQAVFLCGLLWVLDFRSSNGQWSEVFSVILRKKKAPSTPRINTDVPHNEDEDVREERARVKTLIALPQEKAPVVAIDSLRKEFVNRKTIKRKWYKGKQRERNIRQHKEMEKDKGVKVAVRNLSIAVEKGEVFGLLGPNGAGKTSTLRAIVADEIPTRGSVHVAGYDLSKDLKKAIWNMSYCPQHDALWKHVSVKEHLECYAHIRGIKRSMVKKIIRLMMEGLDITEHANKSTENLSGGTKRKLSYALSMLGDPKIVLLDEPSTGMDPKSKRYLWDTIMANFQGTRGAILTTHSMEEADFLSSRVGIMVKGELRCVGSTQHLKNKYGSGYVLEAKVLADGERNQRFVKLEDLVKRIFPLAVLQEKFQDRIRYHIPQTGSLSLAQIFATLEEAKRDIGIEEYSFSQTSLEQLFLDFAKNQDFEDSMANLQFQESLKKPDTI